MSSMLEQAIVDAAALKEAALKNAENSIIEKYSMEVKETLDKLLEQEEDPLGGMDMGAGAMDMGMDGAGEAEDVAPDTPLAALEGDKACPCPDEDEEIELDLDLSALSQAVTDLSTSEMGTPETQEDLLQQVAESQEFEFTEEDIINLLSEDVEEATESEDVETEINEETEESDEIEEKYSFEDELVNKVFERLRVDLEPTKQGWAGTPPEKIEAELEAEAAKRQDTEVAEEVEDLKKAAEDLKQENSALKEQNNKFSSAVLALKEKLDEVTLSNARLLYTNRVLSSTSLNERQKKKIVEAISNAGSAQEAKVIFDTLQSTVGSSGAPRKPKSLSEAISRPSAVLKGSHREPKTESNPLLSRMQKLAGIK